MSARAHLSVTGRFRVDRNRSGYIGITHEPTGLGCGGFAHPSVRTFRRAIDGINAVEAMMKGRDLDVIDGKWVSHTAYWEAVRNLKSAFRHVFGEGVWSC